MSRWFRFYDDAVNDPKLLRLSDAMFRAWTTLLCIASKNDGVLPPAADIALMLRMKATKVAEWLAVLTAGGLLDNNNGVFIPHNWNARQFKSDVSTERVKRFRKQERNVSETANETPPETEQIQTTEQKQKSEPIGSGALAPIDHRRRLFSEGLSKLAAMTGKGPDACRSFVGKCLKAASDDAITVLGLIEDAERNQVADPSAWIAARIKTTGPPSRPLTEFQRRRNETKDILDELGNYARGGGSEENPRLLSGDPGQRSEGVHGGIGANVIDLPAISDRSGG